MQPEQIKALIESGMPGSEVQVGVEGSHVRLLVISDLFADMSKLKRHQRVYAALADSIASGVIHAVHIDALTREEWQQKQ